MPAKAPMYLKPTANSSKPGNGNSRGSRKLRDVLSTEMISLPMGDFRHTAHVGRGADDVFGDTTFLQHNENSDNNPEIVITRGSLRRSAKTNKKSRYGRNKSDRRPLSNQSYDGFGPSESPLLQSAISLPMLNQPSRLSIPKTLPPDTKSMKTKKSTRKNANNSSNIAYNKAKSHETGLNCLSVTTSDTDAYQRHSTAVTTDYTKRLHQMSLNSVGESENSNRSSATLPEKAPVTSLMMSSKGDTTSADELLTFDLDLGGSLLDEIMHVLDKTDF